MLLISSVGTAGQSYIVSYSSQQCTVTNGLFHSVSNVDFTANNVRQPQYVEESALFNSK